MRGRPRTRRTEEAGWNSQPHVETVHGCEARMGLQRTPHRDRAHVRADGPTSPGSQKSRAAAVFA